MSEDTGIHELPDQNERTRVGPLPYPQSRPLDAHDAFIAAYDRLNGLARIARNPAVLVAAVDSHARVFDGLSRVHLLLIRSGDEVLAIDTASTNGTFRGGTKIHTSTLHNPDALMLGSAIRIHWRRLPGRPLPSES